jgi:hypothetical protein
MLSLQLQRLPQEPSRSPPRLGRVPLPMCPGDWGAWAGPASPVPAVKLGLRQPNLDWQLSLRAPLSQMLNGLNHPPQVSLLYAIAYEAYIASKVNARA